MRPPPNPFRSLRWPRLATGLATLALAGCGTSPVMTSYVAEERTESFMQEDFTRYFRVVVPERRELGPAAPVVLAFHGFGQNEEQFRALSGLDAAAEEGGFIVVYLQAAMGAWDVFESNKTLGLDELAYVREVIDRVHRAYVTDTRRVIAVGLSNGGVMAQQVGCRLSDRIAGIVSVAASMPRLMGETCFPDRPMSALYLLGTADAMFPVAGGGAVLPVDSSMQIWARAADCEGQRHRSALPDREDDGTVVYHSAWRPCRDGARVELDSIVGGGHAWPGGTQPAPASFGPTSREISANAEIIRFLGTIPRR
jgi:polyhydroxybutyrate depolymerase